VDLDRFTAILASRLSAIVPAGFHVEDGGGMLWYSAAHLSGRAGTHMRRRARLRTDIARGLVS